MSMDLDKRSTIKNLCAWAVSFKLPNSNGEVFLDGDKKITINNGELVTLIDNGNVFFCGTGDGNHAKIYIENADVRKHVGFESEDGKTKQFVLDDEECQKIFDLKTLSTFKKHVEEKVLLNHEKRKIMDYARKIKLNDYDKIEFLISHCELPFKEEKQE